MEIKRTPVGNTMEVRVAGRLDAYWSDHLTRALDEVVRAGSHRIRLDLAEVTYISSMGLRVLVQFHQELERLRGTFLVSNPSEPVKRVIAMARLDALLLAETEPAPVSQLSAQAPRLLTRPSVGFQVRRLERDASLQCRVSGKPELLEGCRFGAEHSRTQHFPASTIGLGLGAFGHSFEDSQERFGEFMAVAGGAAYQPTDGSNVPDYLLAEGNFVPELQVLYGIRCEGTFSHLARFEAAPDASAATFTEIVDACLEIAGGGAAGVAIVAESAGLVGAALRRSPAAPNAAAGAPFRHPEVRRWLSFTTERAFPHSLAVVAGVVARAPATELQPLLRPIGALWGHFHAAAFSYRPLKKGRIDLESTVRSLFGAESLLGVLHLLGDDRQGTSAESEFVRGACWIAPISEIVAE
jgi:anti-anti-sigma factor